MTMTRMKRLAAGTVICAMVAGAQPALAEAGQVQTERSQRDQDWQRDRDWSRDRDWQRSVRRVRAYQTDFVRVWLSAGWHQVTVIGNGRSDLDLYVNDAWGRRLAVDEDPTDYCARSFHLRRSGYVEIRVRNLGRSYNQYELIVR